MLAPVDLTGGGSATPYAVALVTLPWLRSLRSWSRKKILRSRSLI